MEMREVVEQINRANAYSRKNRISDSEKILDKVLEDVLQFQSRQSKLNLDFSTRAEFFLWCHMNPNTNVTWNRNFLSEIYLIKGLNLLPSRKYSEALTFFERALRWNPVSVNIHQQILDTCILMRDYDRFDMYFERVLKIAMRPIDIASLYIRLGKVWLERGKNEIAYNLFLYSKFFFQRKEADNEIEFLEGRMATKLKKYPDLGTYSYVKEKGFLYSSPKYVISTYFALIKAMHHLMIREEYQTRKNYMMLLDFYNALYFHRPGEQIHLSLLSTQREYDLKFLNKKGG